MSEDARLRLTLPAEGRVELRRNANGITLTVWHNLNRSQDVYVASDLGSMDALFAHLRDALAPDSWKTAIGEGEDAYLRLPFPGEHEDCSSEWRPLSWERDPKVGA